jgi:anti-sigma factor RsiW
MEAIARMWRASCAETAARMSDHLDGELTGIRRRRIAAHLARCEECSAVLASLSRTVDSLRRLGRSEVPGISTVDAVLARIRVEGAPA